MQQATENPFSRESLPDEVIESWQNMLNLAAELLGVPAGLITRISGSEIEIFLSSDSNGNPYYEGIKAKYPDSGFYCEWVAMHRQMMLLPDARKDPLWRDNAAISMNMVSYLGLPIKRPDGEVFGTICFLDSKENEHNQTVIRLAEQFKRMIELTLNAVSAKNELNKQERLLHKLSQVFPICSYCKKIRSDYQQWIPVERYINDISGKIASHGICPECYEKETRCE
jgi:GAF domain-containing protein